jgi:hypothetical protein
MWRLNQDPQHPGRFNEKAIGAYSTADAHSLIQREIQEIRDALEEFKAAVEQPWLFSSSNLSALKYR